MLRTEVLKLKFTDNYERLSPEEPVKGTDYFNEVLKFHKIDLSDPEKQIILQWKNIAGPSIASITKCKGLNNGVLEITCLHSAQAGLVRLHSCEIIKNIKTVFPQIRLDKINIRTK